MAEPLRIKVDSTGSDGPEIDKLIQMTFLKGTSVLEIIDSVEMTWELLRKGAPIPKLHSPLEVVGFEKDARYLIIDIARTRKRSNEKYVNGDSLFFTSEGLRWATPRSAAEHCARRLGRELVMDVTCGQGGQLLSLSDTCRRVIGIDIDPLNCLIAYLNCRTMEKENVTIVNGDCLDPSVVELSDEGCAVFSDPARPPGAVERNFEEIIPNPGKVKEAYGGIASGMCFEIPPYIDLNKVDMECEVEYLSIDGRVNRLNIYTGDLISTSRSAVVLPDGAELKGTPKKIENIVEDELNTSGLLFEVDPAIVRAGLEHRLADELGIAPDIIHLDGRRCMLRSSGPLDSPFLKQGYKILSSNVSEKGLIPALKRVGAGSVTIRYGVDPKEYWDVRRSLEINLDGTRKVQLFKGVNYLIMERM